MAKQQKSAVGLDIKPEDIAFAQEKNQWGCAIVRCIQRTLPDSLNVKANRKTISFRLERDDIRYTFITPEDVIEKVIKPFDLGQPIELSSFVLTNPISAEPVQHRSREERQQHRLSQRRRRSNRTRTSSAAVKTYERFLEDEA